MQRFIRKFKTMRSIRDMQVWVFFFISKTEDMRLKVRQNKFGENGYCGNYFINEFLPYISCNSKGTKLQRISNKQYLGIPKNGYQA